MAAFQLGNVPFLSATTTKPFGDGLARQITKCELASGNVTMCTFGSCPLALESAPLLPHQEMTLRVQKRKSGRQSARTCLGRLPLRATRRQPSPAQSIKEILITELIGPYLMSMESLNASNSCIGIQRQNLSYAFTTFFNLFQQPANRCFSPQRWR